MKKIYLARKFKQFKTLSRRVQFLLKSTDQETIAQLQKLKEKLKKLILELRFAYSRVELKKILGAAALVFGLSFSNQVSGQWFSDPVENPFGLVPVSYFTSPRTADLDDDGDLDLLTGADYGIMQYYENTGTTSNPAFAAPQANPFGLDSTYRFALPAFADLDNDGDIDLMVGEYYGNLQYFENVGTASEPAFANPVQNPFGITRDSTFSAPEFADLDNDGDFDLLVSGYYEESDNSYNSAFKYYENIGSASEPNFANPVENPFNLDLLVVTLFTLGDLDEDGDFDIMSGWVGAMSYYENIGSASEPNFAVVQDDPFGLTDFDFMQPMAPEFADLDNDGDLDLLAGRYGVFTDGILYYENIEPTGIKDLDQDVSLQLYPNPAKDILRIDTDQEIESIEMVDILGKMVLRSENSNSTISVSDLSPGLYTVRVTFSDGNYTIKKILKE
ncbi:MAG: hypothetical protein DRI54_08595 [Bacteroidetes bacterium]|nr:MAG: hypothetical protein DRI54_08595 [Bacteroidota bacterium]